jgi:hypothetical protein
VLEVKGHIPHFQKREKRGCRTMILLLPLFWKTLRKSWMFSMEGKNHHYSKIKNGMFEAKWHFFLYFLSLLKDWPPLSVFSQGLSFTFRPLFGPTPHHFPVHLQWFATPQLSTYWGCTPPCTFRSSQKDCPSLYHPLVRICFNKIVRRNIHFSVISHSLCNRKVILFSVICISHS